jgi:protein ImuB
MMIVCVYFPRFELVVAAGGPEALAGRAVAVAPLAGSRPVVGQVSGAAEASGVSEGMALGEALACCPTLVLVAGDPLKVAQAWEQTARALEGIGAGVELGGPGLAYFEAGGLEGLHGGNLDGVIAAARRAVGRSARIGAGPTRFCALAAAFETRSRRPRVIEEQAVRRYLAGQPVRLLSFRAQTTALVAPLERLGLRTLGALASLGSDAAADRFGEPGALARGLALGRDTPLRTRRVEDRLEESLELAESSSGEALERTLGVLVDRLLARPERRGRTIRAALLFARLVERGTWCERVVFRQALADRRRMRLALSLKLALLPAPAETLGLAVERFGPASGDQGTLLGGERTARQARLRDAVAQVRAVAGPNGALRALPVDPDSRVPERRFVFTPLSP